MIKHSSPQTTWVYFSVWLPITVPSPSEARAGSQGRLVAGTEAQAGEERCSLAHTPQLLQTVLRSQSGVTPPSELAPPTSIQENAPLACLLSVWWGHFLK